MKNNSLINILFFLCFASSGYSQNFKWAKQIGGNDIETATTIAVDDFGNVYTAGSFAGTADFDPGVATFNLTSVGNSDIFISKLDSSGNFIWAKQIGGAGYDGAHAMTVDFWGNIYVTGFFESTTDFDPGTGIFNLTTVGLDDVFACKLDSSGNFLWVRQIAGPDNEDSYAVTLDDSNNIFTTGRFVGTVDFDPGAGIYNMTSTGIYVNMFILKLDSNGNFLWAKQITGNGSAISYSIKTDSYGNVYTSGHFDETADFDPGAGTFNLTADGIDIFIAKLDASGNFLWSKKIGGIVSDESRSMVVSDSGNIYLTGFFDATADFDPGPLTYNLTTAGLGPFDIFISKLDSSGNFLWAKQLGGINPDLGFSIAIDAFENVYTTGYFVGTADFDPGVGIFNLTSAGADDIFISKLNSSGNFGWAVRMGGIDYEDGSAITVDATGNIYTTGSFKGIADFDPGGLTYNLTAIGINRDIFISKLGNVISSIDYESYKKSSFNIFPNPTTGMLNFDLGKIYNKVEVTIRNIIGKKIFTQNYSITNAVDFTFAEAPGVYSVELKTDDERPVVFKVIKQ